MTEITEALVSLLAVVITTLAAWLGNKLRKRLDDKTKTDVAKDAVRFVEQVYIDLHGEEKLKKATEAASEMLAAKGITVTALELRVLIESAVLSFRGAIVEGADDGQCEIEYMGEETDTAET